MIPNPVFHVIVVDEVLVLVRKKGLEMKRKRLGASHIFLSLPERPEGVRSSSER